MFFFLITGQVKQRSIKKAAQIKSSVTSKKRQKVKVSLAVSSQPENVSIANPEKKRVIRKTAFDGPDVKYVESVVKCGLKQVFTNPIVSRVTVKEIQKEVSLVSKLRIAFSFFFSFICRQAFDSGNVEFFHSMNSNSFYGYFVTMRDRLNVEFENIRQSSEMNEVTKTELRGIDALVRNMLKAFAKDVQQNSNINLDRRLFVYLRFVLESTRSKSAKEIRELISKLREDKTDNNIIKFSLKNKSAFENLMLQFKINDEIIDRIEELRSTEGSSKVETIPKGNFFINLFFFLNCVIF